jgi:tight adherence protein C
MTVVFIAIFAALALFAASALVFVMMLEKSSPTETRLAALQSQSRAAYDTEAPGKLPGKLQAQDALALITRPLAPFRNWLRSNDAELSYRLSIAGYRKPEDADTFLSLKLLAPVVGILLATFTGNFLLYGMFFAVGAFFVPDMWLFSAMSRRKAKINRALPDALDLLVICMEAGLGIDQAVLRIAKEIELIHPELSAELSTIGYEQRAGKPRLEAWRSMSDRVDLDTVRQFVAMLVQTERLGTPIAKSLGQFADALRVKRLMLAEEQAAKTTVKLIFPLALFIFPAIFVVLLGPGVLTMLKTMEDINR